MFDQTMPIKADAIPSGHPNVPAKKVGILLANLGTPDNYDYWSMRRYLSDAKEKSFRCENFFKRCF